MKTVNSISGGKTSSFMMIKYPADYNIFALVKSSNPAIRPKDSGIEKEIRNRVPDFVASTESDLTLKLILDLEQYSGQKITWVSSETTFDDFAKQGILPNLFKRFCTQKLKIEAIHTYIHTCIHAYIGDKVEMRIGFRSDESHRSFEWEIKEKDIIRFPLYTKIKKNSGEPMKRPLKHWEKIHWRKCRFPLIDDKITKTDINEFWKNKPLIFPLVSNCVGCFFHSDSELSLNWQTETGKMQYFAELEKTAGRTFKKGKTYEDIKNESLFNIEFNGKPCISGYCGI